MSNLVTFSGANLPSVKSLSTSLRKLTPNGAAAGVAIIKMDRTGHWVFGADQTEIEDASAILISAQRTEWGPVGDKGKLHDRASYRFFWHVLERAHATGRAMPTPAQSFFRA